MMRSDAGKACKKFFPWSTPMPEGVPWVLKRIIPHALAKRSMQEKSISMRSAHSETIGDFFYAQAS